MRRKIEVLLGYSWTDGRVAVFARVPEEAKTRNRVPPFTNIVADFVRVLCNFGEELRQISYA